MPQSQWPPYKSNTITTVILLYHNNVHVSKITLQICSAINRSNKETGTPRGSQDEMNGCISESPKSVTDLFTLLERKPMSNTILIEGAPGIGKTMLANEIALKWKSIPLLCKREFLFLIYLKDPQVQKAVTLRDLLDTIFQNDKLSCYINEYEKLISICDGSNLAIILDGYDELSHQLIKTSFILSIINRSCLKSSLLIITSRPSVAKHLHAQSCSRIELLGFTEADRDCYLKDSLNEHSKCAIIREHFKRYPAIDANCRIPRNLNILLYLYEKCCLPTTKTEMFENFIYCTMSHFQSKSGFFTVYSGKSDADKKILLEFGNLSFQSLKANKVTFSHQDLQNICGKYLEIKQGNVECPYGLLRSSHWSGSHTISYSFLYVDIQEYLAAWYLSEQERLWSPSEVGATLNRHFWDEKFFNMWLFYIGITKGKQCTFTKFIRRQTWWDKENYYKTTRIQNTLNDKMKCLHLVNCFMEAKDNDSCQKVSTFYFIYNEFFDLSNNHILYEGLSALCFAITHSSECLLTELNLSNCRIGDDGCKYVCTQLHSITSSCTIGVLNLSDNQLTKLSVNFIVDLIVKLNTKALILSGNQLCCEGTLQLIQKCSTLHFLDISKNHILSADAALLNYFFNTDNINLSIVLSTETLCLSNCSCVKKDRRYYFYRPKFDYQSCSVIVSAESDRSRNYIDDKFDNKSLRYLYVNCTLNEHLDIICTWLEGLQLSTLHLVINPKHSKLVHTVIARMKSLTEVYIGQLTDEVADKIVQKLDFAAMVTSVSKFQAKFILNPYKLLANFNTFSFQSLHTLSIKKCNFDVNRLTAAIKAKNNWDSISLLECNVGDDELNHLYDDLRLSKQITVHKLNLMGNNIKHAGSLNHLLHQWKTKELYLAFNDLQYPDFMDIVISAKLGDLILQVLDVRGNNNITELEGLCEHLLLDEKYEVNLSLLSNDQVVCKKIILNFDTPVMCFLMNSRSLNLYIQPISDCFDTFRGVATLCTRTSIQKLYVSASGIDYKIIELLVQMQINKPFDLYLNVITMDDKDIDDLLQVFPHKSLHVQTRTRLLTKNCIIKKSLLLFQSTIISLSLHKCILDKDILYKFGKIIASSNQNFKMISFCECCLHDADLQLLLVKEKENHLPFVKVLNLSGNSLSPLAASNITELLRYWRVEQLSVCSNQLQDNGIEEIVNHVVQHNTISSVDLTDNAASLQLKKVCEVNFFNEQNQFIFVLMDNGLLAVQHINEISSDIKGVQGLYVPVGNRNPKESLGTEVLLDYILPKNHDSLKYLYIACSEIHGDEFKCSLQFLHQLRELYLNAVNLLEKDADIIAYSFGTRLVGCVIVTQTTLKVMNGDELLTVRGLLTCGHSVETVELNNCIVKTERTVQYLAKIFYSSSGGIFQAFKLKKCNLEGHFFKTLTQAFNDKSKLKVKEMDFSHNLLPSASICDLLKMIDLFMPEHLVISNDKLSYGSVFTLFNVITNNCTSLKYLSLQPSDIYHSAAADRLCKQVVLDQGIKLQCFHIAKSMVVDVTACSTEMLNLIKGMSLKVLYITIFSNKQKSTFIKNLRDLLSSFSLLEGLFVLITGPFDLDTKLLNTLQRKNITRRLVVYAEKLPEDTFLKLATSFKSIISIELFSQKKMWISNSDCKMMDELLRYISCDDVDYISIANSPELHEYVHLLAKLILYQCKQLKHLSLTHCCSKDFNLGLLFETIISKFRQDSVNMITLARLNLSFNQLSPHFIPSLIKTVSISRVEELILMGNKVGNVGAEMLIEELTGNLNIVNYLNIDHCGIYKPEKVCQKYYVDLKFNYSFLATSNGIIITKGFLTDYPAIWQDEYLTFSSLYLANKDLLPSRELQNIIIKSNHKLERLYMVLLQNTELQLNSELISSLLVDIQELCLFAPSLSSKSRINIWEKYCQNRSDKQKVLLLSKEALQAKNFESKDSSNIFIRGFEYCRSSVVNIQLINCKLSPLIMNNLTQVLINNRELHHLEICNTDDCEIDSIIQKRQDVTVKIKSITLFHNKLMRKFLNSFINFVNCWSIDELSILHNEISVDCFKMLVHATGTRKSPLKAICAKQNGVEIEEAQELCKIVFFDPVYSIGCFRVQEDSKFDILAIKTTVTSDDRIHSCMDDFVKSCNWVKDKGRHSTSQYCLFIETDYDIIDPLVWTYASKLCVVAPVKDQENLVSKLKENKNLTEIHLYVSSLIDSSLKEISKNLPASCLTTVFLTSTVFKANNAGLLYVDKGLQILSSTTTILHTIIINHCFLSDEMLMLLNHSLERSHLWECLDLSHCSLGDNVRHILQPLSGEITIKTVRLSFNGLQQTTAAPIIKAILHWNTEELFINDNNLRDTGVHKVVAEVCKHSKKCQLTVLNLYNNGVTLDKARSSLIKVHKATAGKQLLLSMDKAVLVQEMQNFPSDLIWTLIIHSLKLFYSFNCGQEVIASVQTHLASLNQAVVCNYDCDKSYSLERSVETSLVKNEESAIITLLGQRLIAKNGSLDMIQMVLNNKGIKINSLNFTFCEVNDNVLYQIAHLVQINRHLQLLSLKGCNLSNDFCKVLLEPLQDTNNLQASSLIFSTNNIKSSAMKDLCKLCCILKTEKVYMDNNELGDDGIKQLARNLSGENHNLHYIDLMNNNAHYMTEYEFNMLSNTKDFPISVEINPNTQQFYKSLPPHYKDLHTTDNLYCIECTFTIQNLADILSLNLNRLHLFGTLHTNEFSSLPQSTFIQAKEIIIVLKNCDDQVAFEIFRNTDTSPIVIVSQFSIQAKNIKESEVINIALRQCQKQCIKKFLFDRCDVTKCFGELVSQLNSVRDKHLEIFQMQNCCLIDNNLTALVKSFNTSGVTSDVVDLSYNQITTESSEIIGNMVKDWQIKKLYLNYNQMSQEGIHCILSTCVLTYHLQDITFEGNVNVEHLLQTEKSVADAVSKFLSLDSRTYFNESLNNCIIMVVCRLQAFYFLRVSVNTSDRTILKGEQSSLEMANIRIYINARNLTSFHYIKGIFKVISDLYCHLEEFFILYDGTLSQFYDKPIDTNSVLNIKCIYSKETQLKDMAAIKYPSLTIRINSNNIIPKLCNFCMLSGITELCVFLHVTQQSYVDNTIAYLLNDVHKIPGLRELILNSVLNDYLQIVPKLVCSNPYLESLNFSGNELDDTQFLQISSQLIQLTSLRYLNLSHNKLSSFSMPRLIELMSSCPVEELILGGNQVNVDGAKMVVENMKALIHVNFIDISDNDVFNADNDCQKYFFDCNFQLSFILTENGVVIARGPPTKQDNKWSYESVHLCSLYIGNEEMLDDINGQNIFDSIELGKLSRVYIVLLRNRPDLSITNIMPLLEITQEIYLCIPTLNGSALEVFYQPDKYKLALLLTTESLYAANCQDDEKIANALDYSKDSIKKLEVYNCTLSFALLDNFASLLYSNVKEWECITFCSCGLSDDHLSHFTERCNEYKKEQTKIVHCINLSNNTLTSIAADKLVSLLELWKSKELYIDHNVLQYSGFERLIGARTGGSICLTVLDIQYNDVDCSGAEKLCEEIFFNSRTPFYQVTLKEEHYNCIVFRHVTTNCLSPSMNNFIALSDESSTTSRNYLFLQTDEIVNQLSITKTLNKLYLITDGSDLSKVSTCLKNQKYLTEVYLYALNWQLSDSLLTQQLTSSCKIKLIVSSDKVEASKVTSFTAITEGLSVLSSCTALNTIKINHCMLNKDCLVLVNTFLWTSTQPRSLKYLDLSCCSLEKNISHLLRSPSKSIHNISIETVDLSSNKLNSAAMDLMVNFVVCLNVQQLYLNDNKIENEGIEKLVSDFVTNENLVKSCRLDFLDISGNLVEHIAIRSLLVETHKIFSNRTFFLFTDESMLVQDASQIPEDLPLFIKYYYVFNCGQNIVDCVKEELHNLKEIVVCNADTINASKTVTITKQIQDKCENNSKAIYAISMGREILAWREQADWIEIILSESSAVNVIKFRDCNLSDGVISKLASKLIKNNKDIDEVSLTGCTVTDANCKLLSQSLSDSSTCCKVTSLNVSDNLISSSAVNDIVDLLCILKIEKLYVNNNNLCDGGIQLLSKKLGMRKNSLTYAEFKGNNSRYVTEYEVISNSSCNCMQVVINEKAKLFNGMLPPINQFDYKIEDLCIINYNFSFKQLKEILALTIKRLYLRGSCNISNFNIHNISIQVKELFIVLKNLSNEVAELIFEIAQCPIVIASKSAIRAKKCDYAELINIALRESHDRDLKYFHFIACDFIDDDQELAVELQNTHNKDWKIFQLKGCYFSEHNFVALLKSLTSVGVKSEVVDLSHNLITSQSADTIGDMINNWQISELYLNDNQISLEGIENIVKHSTKAIHLQKLNLENNSKTNYIHHARNDFEIISLLNKVDYFKQSSFSCIIMIICGNDMFYFLTLSVVNGEDVLNGEQSILEQVGTKIYINAASFKSSHFIDQIIKSRNYEELYILSDEGVTDCYKRDPSIETVVDIGFVISTTALHLSQFQGYNHPSLRIIVNSSQGTPKEPSNLPNMCFFIQILPVQGVVDVIKIYLSTIIEFSSIRSLYINCNEEFSRACNISDNIVNILEANTDLQCLNISDNNIDDCDFSKISEKLKCISSLKSIDISSNEITDKSFDVLEVVLQSNCGLKEINFSDICINEIAFSASLKKLTQLTTLKLSASLIGMSQDAVANLSEIIANNVNLECLDISNNQIGDNIPILLNSMQHHKSLIRLNISSNQISDTAMIDLIPVLKKNPRLVDIDLSNNQLSCEDCLNNLKRMQLKKLNICYTGAANSDTNDYISVLKDCIALEEINLSFVNLQVVSILIAMNNISTLRKVCLRRCNIKYSDTSNLANLVSKNTQLEFIDISENAIKNIGFQRVLNALVSQDNCHLKVLLVADNKMVLTSALLEKLSPNKLELLELDISNNTVEESFIVNLFENFINLKCLKIFNVSQTSNNPSCTIDKVLHKLMTAAIELKELDISGYTLTCDRAMTFQRHQNLKEVALRNCNIHNKFVDKLKILFNLDNLKCLDLSNNPMEISFAKIPIKRIHRLKLQDCCVLSTNLEWMLNKNSLRVLHLCDNDLGDKWFKLTQQPTEILASFIAQSALSLRELCLRQCNLKMMRCFE